jgi:aminomethyltransferase
MAFDPSTFVRQHTDPQEEARACRSECALFDFSFVARARIAGADAVAAIGRLTHRPLDDLRPGRIAYAVRENERGHLVSDLTIWRHGDRYEVMSGRAEDICELVSRTPSGAEDLTADHAIFAVQGPRSLHVLAELSDVTAIANLAYFSFTETRIADVPCMVGRLGYTGEQGFEILLPRRAAGQVWSELAQRARPAGFAAADILRIEAGFVLFANEFQVAATAAEAGLWRFSGTPPASAEPTIRLVSFKAAAGKKPVLWSPGPTAQRPSPGTLTITSACQSPVANGILGLGFAVQSDVEAGERLHDATGQFTDIEIVPLPFFDGQKRRPRRRWESVYRL